MIRISHTASVLAALALATAAAADSFTITALGDSVTRGYPLSIGNPLTYPNQLRSRLAAAFPGDAFNVVNRGINGITADGLRDRLANENWLAADNPDVVLLMIGGNDLIQAAPAISTQAQLDALYAQTAAEVQQIVDLVNAHQNPDGSSPALIVSGFTPNLLPNVLIDGVPKSPSIAVHEYNQTLASSLTGIDAWFDDNFNDLFEPATQRGRPALYFDQVHPNGDGFSLIADNFFDQTRVYIPEPAAVALLALGSLLLHRRP